MLTQKYLKEILKYNNVSGAFTWIRTSTRRKCGKPAGSITNGYTVIVIDRKKNLAHRLAWIYVYGKNPKGEIDHINKDRSDNRIHNLRDVSRSENQRNRKINNNNISGFNGVYFSKKSNKWCAYIKVGGKSIGLGTHSEKEDAIEARKKANIKYGFHSNHGYTI